MNRLSAIGIIIVILLLGIGLVSAEAVTDQKVIPIPEFPAIAILIAFFVGIIGAALYILSIKEK
ncbi:MAG: hypothetical protein ABSE07_07575 [Methanoregula sp.]